MKEFTYVIKEELGLHARPAGLLVKEAKKFQSATTLAAKGKTAAAGKLIAIKNVTENNDLMIIEKSGLTIRMAVSDIRVAGRATQGVKLINIKNGDSIAAISTVEKGDDEQEKVGGENAETPQE